LEELMEWFRAGRLKYRETVAEGLESAPAALINMLSGGNIGKQVVRTRCGCAVMLAMRTRSKWQEFRENQQNASCHV